MMVRVVGVFLANEQGTLKHISREAVATLTEVEPGGPWQVVLRFGLRKGHSGPVGVDLPVTVPRGAAAFDAGASTEDGIQFEGTLHITRGRIVIYPEGGAERLRYEV